MPEYVGGFGHKVHAAEDDVAGIGLGSSARKAVRVAAEIGEAYDFVALVVVAEDDAIGAKGIFRSLDTALERVVGQNEIIVQRTRDGCYRGTHCVPRLQLQRRRLRQRIPRLQSVILERGC